MRATFAKRTTAKAVCARVSRDRRDEGGKVSGAIVKSQSHVNP